MSRQNSSASQHDGTGDDDNEEGEDMNDIRPVLGRGRENWRMRLVTQIMEEGLQLPMGRSPPGNANRLGVAREEGSADAIPVGGMAQERFLFGNMPRIENRSPNAGADAPNDEEGTGTSNDEEGAVGGVDFVHQPRVLRPRRNGQDNFGNRLEGPDLRINMEHDYDHFQPLYTLVTRPNMAEGPLDVPPGMPHYRVNAPQLGISPQAGHPLVTATLDRGDLAAIRRSPPRSPPRQASATGEWAILLPSSLTLTLVRGEPSTSGAIRRRSESPPSTSAAAALANSANSHSSPTADADTAARASPTIGTPKGKRKRLTLEPSQAGTPKMPNRAEDDPEDGLICPICLDVWEMSGDHRLVSLKCGHLFGESCIRRWLNECSRQGGQKACPQCKARAKSTEIRHLYAKRLRALDRTEEHDLKKQLEDEKALKTDLAAEVSRLKMTLAMYTTRVDTLQLENDRMKQTINGLNAYREPTASTSQNGEKPLLRLSLERNVELSPEPGSRVMAFSKVHASLLVSQKSGMQGLFPGYGLRILETEFFRPITFIHTSGKYLRDLSLSHDEGLVAVASMEPRVKLFDVRTHAFNAVIMPNDKAIWSCAFGRTDRDNTIFVGAQHGSTFVYDTRFPENILEEYQNTADISPIINIAPIASCPLYPYGGFIVCKMQSLWFYEFLSAGYDAKATRLGAEGPFVSMNYDDVHQNIVLFTRTNSRNPTSRYIFGKLDKVMGTPTFTEISVFFGSKSVPVMTRCSQIPVNQNVLIATYIQDEKKLALFDTARETRTQSVPIQSVVYDNCPISNAEGNFLAALTETKLRIYKLTNKP